MLKGVIADVHISYYTGVEEIIETTGFTEENDSKILNLINYVLEITVKLPLHSPRSLNLLQSQYLIACPLA